MASADLLVPEDIGQCDREWLCRRFLPSLAGGGTVTVPVFLRLLRECRPTDAVAMQRLGDRERPVLVVGPLRGHTDVARTLALAAARNPLLCVVFLGDYVDGGRHSVEALSIALATRLALGADRVAVLRGRHEQLFPMPQKLTGAHEGRLDNDIRWRAVRFVANERLAKGLPISGEEATAAEAELMGEMESAVRACFAAMPLAATVHSRFFCCAGGPTCGALTLDAVENLSPTAEFGKPAAGPVNDLTCSEAADEDEDALLSKDGAYFARNIEMGVGAVFSYAAACEFLKKNELHSIVRGSLMPLNADPPLVSIAFRHSTGKFSPSDPGFRFGRATPIGSPSTITLFSAPRLAGRAQNLGAVLWIANGVASVQQFDADPTRGVQLPHDHKRSAFDWSMPLVVEHLASALSWMATPDPGESDDDKAPEEVDEERALQSRLARFRRLCK
eukprot:CAMPEP_0174845836 /NCGR_PEP_ID=MMETSP1114-20130205/11960_1 /TAXON_ID=312471 /ORGANISM="Neobodo designis, Strain CCAP 1951/1" /LENGTH=446 /DNA_ID=CAMNT_0016080091 /DNA_START=53 /DNA_END=1390 /DNA_ORIENTATION=-